MTICQINKYFENKQIFYIDELQKFMRLNKCLKRQITYLSPSVANSAGFNKVRLGCLRIVVTIDIRTASSKLLTANVTTAA